MSDLTENHAISPSARKLAERYGVSPEVMEEIISDTRSRAEVRRVTSPNTVVGAAPEAPPQLVAAPQPVYVAPVIQPAPPVTVVTPPLTEPRPQDREGSLSAITVILIILLILALVGLIFLWQSQREGGEKKVVTQDTTHVQSAVPPLDTNRTMLVADSAITPEVVAPVIPAHHLANSRNTHRTPSNKFYTTSSMLGAQEHLAELRASGNRSAYLETVQKGNNTYYRLHNSKATRKHRRRH